MIEHGVTGFLGNCDEELAHYAAMLAYDEGLRMTIAENARRRLEEELAEPNRIWGRWQRLFDFVSRKGAETIDEPAIAVPV